MVAEEWSRAPEADPEAIAATVPVAAETRVRTPDSIVEAPG